MKYCTQCGKEMNDDTLYCTGCGHKLPGVSEPQNAFFGQAAAVFSDVPENGSSTGSPLQDSAAYIPSPSIPSYEAASLPYRGVFPEAEPEEEKKTAKPVHPHKHASTFKNTGLGLILCFVLLCAAVFIGVITPRFFDDVNIMNMIKQCGLFALIAIAAVLTSRAGGIDLSIVPCISLSGIIIARTMLTGGSVMSGVLLSASAALLLGLINGFATVMFKKSALIVTFASGMAVSGINLALTQGQLFGAAFSGRTVYFADTSVIGIIALLGAAFVLAFVFHLLTKTGRPFSEREEKTAPVSYMFAYLASAEIAAAVGFVLLVRTRSAVSSLDIGAFAFVIFVYALLTSSRLFDNRVMPMLVALTAGIIWGIVSSVFTLWGVYSYYQPIVYSSLALICLLVSFISRYERRKT